MNDNTQPVTTTAPDTDRHRTPRVLSQLQMRQHLDDRSATPLASGPRHRVFVRYDGVWWISDRDAFIEITDTDHNRRLDQWHVRLSHGALWT